MSTGAPTNAVRRTALARAIVRTIAATISDPSQLSIELDDGPTPGPGQAGVAVPGEEAAGAPTASSHARTRILIRGPDAVARALFLPRPDALAEAYLRGDIDIVGDVGAAVDAGSALDLRQLTPADLRRIARWGLELRRGAAPAPRLQRVARLDGVRHSRARDLEAVRFHYDVGNEFFSLWLDRRLTYSCAYFEDGTTAELAADRLDGAQEAKLELIARKLHLGPHSRLLDIGCGWGSLIGLAAERAGSTCVGVTLSQRQADEANERLARSGQADRATARVLDYRDLDGLGSFDAVASVGMFEHVGRGNLPRYFAAALDALRPGGLFLNHGIAQAGPPARARARRQARGISQTSPFVERYVFPDGELVPVDEAIAAARTAGFEVLDVQSLRPHYALTLAAWVSRLEARWDEAVAAAGAEVARTWRLYLSGARLGFERGDLDVCQLLLARPQGRGRPAEVPLRPWW